MPDHWVCDPARSYATGFFAVEGQIGRDIILAGKALFSNVGRAVCQFADSF